MEEGAQGKQMEEIAALERLLAEKKQNLLTEGKIMPEKEAFREAFRESLGEALSPQTTTVTPPPVSTLTPDEVTKHASDVAAKEREEQVAALVEIALTKGIPAAAEIARKATPWLMDALHDELQDHYYDKLLQARKLKAL